MSFDTMKPDELMKVAEAFGVDVPADQRKKKELIIAALTEEGVDYAQYLKFVKPEVVEVIEPPVSNPEPVEKKVVRAAPPERQLLVKMERANIRFDVHGKTFTKEHPFVLCTEDEAQAIFDTEAGFRPATPREAQEYYS